MEDTVKLITLVGGDLVAGGLLLVGAAVLEAGYITGQTLAASDGMA
jgi:hypothetical protein